MEMEKSLNILTVGQASGYALIDSGQGQKLERFGRFILSRPDPQALWHKRLSSEEWKKADGIFTDSWDVKKTLPNKWQISLDGLELFVRLSSFKHVGLFPEQAPNWSWLRDRLNDANKGRNTETIADLNTEVLNLFGYTGGATLAVAQAGAKVVHVDGSKAAVNWARENAELSGLKDRPIRWLIDDAHIFVKREIKRGRKYQGIIMDPPSFGHGPSNELWKIEDDLLSLIDDCLKILSDDPIFFLINGYAAGYSAISYRNILSPIVEKFGGQIETGELTIREAENPGFENSGSARLLPCGIFARWSR